MTMTGQNEYGCNLSSKECFRIVMPDGLSAPYATMAEAEAIAEPLGLPVMHFDAYGGVLGLRLKHPLRFASGKATTDG